MPTFRTVGGWPVGVANAGVFNPLLPSSPLTWARWGVANSGGWKRLSPLTSPCFVPVAVANVGAFEACLLLPPLMRHVPPVGSFIQEPWGRFSMLVCPFLSGFGIRMAIVGIFDSCCLGGFIKVQHPWRTSDGTTECLSNFA